MKTRLHCARAGFSLVLGLIILTLLAILVVGFLSSSAMDRATARAFADKAQAETAAGSAVNQAMSTLREYLAQYPDSATVWEKLAPSGGGPEVEGTMLYYSDQPLPTGLDTKPVTAPKRYLLPLLSRGVDENGVPLGPVELKDKAKALGTEAWHEAYWTEGKFQREPNCIDLNRPRFNDDQAGWIGAAPDGRKPYHARWIEVKENGDLNGRTIGRYAFWVEDESFKVNLNLLDNHLDKDPGNPKATQAGRGKEAVPGSTPGTEGDSRLDVTKPLPLQIAGLIPIQGLLRSARSPASPDRTLAAQTVKNRRNLMVGYRLPDLSSFNQLVSYQTSADTEPRGLAEQTKFLATVFSGGLNLSRHGSQRLNLNGLGFKEALTATTPIDTEINLGIKRLVETIKYHAPQFGQRFYRLITTTDPDTLNEERVTDPVHRNIYLHKIAANIRDYIDPDSQPTMITNAGQVAPRTTPLLAMSAHDGPNDIWAQGKDGAPFLQEAVTRFRTEVKDGRYTLKVDYYIEFWNMTDRDIHAGPQPYDSKLPHLNNAFVKIADPVGWFGHGGGTPQLTADSPPDPGEGRDLVLDLTKNVFQTDRSGESLDGTLDAKGNRKPLGVVFKAGACTVISSDPDGFVEDRTLGTTYSTGGKNATNVYYCSSFIGRREFEGPVPTRSDGIWPQFRDGATRQEDYGTEVIFGNSLGYLDSHPFTISKGGGPNVTYREAGNGVVKRKTKRDDTFGGSLFGNGIAPSQTGDPRTNNEQMSFTRYKPGTTSEPDQTRYFNPSQLDENRFSLGWPNSRFVFPGQDPYPWKDYYKVWTRTVSDSPAAVLNPNADTAPAVVASAPLVSIGQLGDIFDPARVKSAVGTGGLLGARGGGRTLKIGQPDDLVDSTPSSTLATASRQWASWRLTDFLGTSSEIQLPGQININGLRRDNGAALRAACFGMTIHSASCAATATTPTVTREFPLFSDESKSASPPSGLDRLIAQAVNRLNQTDPGKPSYFAERGELSELPLFSTATDDLLSGVKMKDAFDGTREELFRRLAELITTRGNIFSVYAIGQAITESPDAARTKRVTSTHQVKVTFALIPKKASGLAGETETFDPANVDPTYDPAKPGTISLPVRFAKPDSYDVQILQVTNL